MKKTIFILLFSLFTTFSFGQKTLSQLLEKHNTKSVPYISVSELRMNQINKEVVILDAREKEEYMMSHIQGSQFVGYDEFDASKVSEKIKDKETPIVVYCSLGIRSEDVGEKLKKVGYTNVKNLYGGIFEWKSKDYPILNAQEKKTDTVHTFSKDWSKWLEKGIKHYPKEKKQD